MLREDKKKIMVVFAHPDDAEFTSGGSIARWATEGDHVTYVVCTDGSRGTDSPETDPPTLAETRRSEQRAAARALGVKDLVFLDYEDGELDRTRDPLRMQLIGLIQEHRPDRVVTWDPWRPYQLHRDHTAAGHAAFYAAVESADPVPVSKQGGGTLVAHRVDELYLFGTDRPDTWIDISDFVEKKREAIRCHESQVGRGEEVEERLLAWSRTLGQERGLAFAEAFKVLRPHCEICR